MIRVITVITFLLFAGIARAQYSVTTDTNGLLNAANNGRSTNFFKTNITRLEAAMRGITFNNQTHTNAVLKNSFADGLSATNFSAPDVGSGSTRIGSLAEATNTSSVAIGTQAKSYGASSVALGTGSETDGESATAIGDNAIIGLPGTGSTALGANSGTTNIFGTALGKSSVVNHDYSTAVGFAATTTADSQIRLGTATNHISIPGEVRGVVSSNEVHRGTNVFNSRVDFTPRISSALVNGANAGIVLGSNVYIRLSGATTVAGISGFAAEQDGSFHIIEISGAITNVIVNEANSTDIATDGTAANRITVGTGTNYYGTNNPFVFKVIYNGSAQRWRLLDFLR